jgi:UDPglucose 6-dehydrogenase
VGLTTAACIAHLGHEVAAVDVDEERVALMNSGLSPILEQGLAAFMQEGLEQGTLRFTCEAASAASAADFVFLCVPTPQGADGSADLTILELVAAEIAPHLMHGAVVVNKSTVPIGTARAIMASLGRSDVAVVSNPEFLREGHAVNDWMHPDRIVIGSDDCVAAQRLSQLYEPLGAPLLITDPASSETIKYACNAFLATKVSFVNAVAQLCDAVGADAVDVIRGMAFDRRIGGDHLAPGPGWGGSCFPKDTHALLHIADAHGFNFSLLKGVIAANEDQFDFVANQVELAAGGCLEGAIVAAWGLTFKSGTDDLRDSPSLAVLRRVRARGAYLKAFDPTAPDPLDGHFQDLTMEHCADPYSACEGAETLVVLTEWAEFRDVDFGKVSSLMARPHIVDTRNLLDPAVVRRAGLTYCGMGRR